MSAVQSGDHKRKREDEDTRALYTPQWECPLCMDELGRDAGLVPCVITSCRPVAHLVCYTCAQNDTLRNGAPCPLCRTPIGVVLPIGALVDDDADAVARATLDSIDPSRVGSGDPVADAVSSGRNCVSGQMATEADIIAKRVSKIVERVAHEDRCGTLPQEPARGHYLWWSTPFDWDTRWRMRCRVPGKTYMKRPVLLRYLSNEAAKCNAALRQVYQNAPYSVTMAADQVRPPVRETSDPKYLVVYVRRRVQIPSARV